MPGWVSWPMSVLLACNKIRFSRSEGQIQIAGGAIYCFEMNFSKQFLNQFACLDGNKRYQICLYKIKALFL